LILISCGCFSQTWTKDREKLNESNWKKIPTNKQNKQGKKRINPKQHFSKKEIKDRGGNGGGWDKKKRMKKTKTKQNSKINETNEVNEKLELWEKKK